MGEGVEDLLAFGPIRSGPTILTAKRYIVDPGLIGASLRLDVNAPLVTWSGYVTNSETAS